MVSTSGIDAVLVRHNFPEFGADLVSALASLKVDNLSHLRQLKSSVVGEGRLL